MKFEIDFILFSSSTFIVHMVPRQSLFHIETAKKQGFTNTSYGDTYTLATDVATASASATVAPSEKPGGAFGPKPDNIKKPWCG